MQARSIWRSSEVYEVKTRILTTIAEAENAYGHEGCVRFCLTKIDELQSMVGDQPRLEILIYIIELLKLQGNKKTLTDQQIRQLLKIADTVAKVQGINNNRSRLSFLLGELQIAYAHLLKLDGQHWASTWSHYLSFYDSKGALNKDKGFQTYMLALQSMRLGHIENAISYLESSLDGLDELDSISAILSLAKCYRIIGKLDEAKKALDRCSPESLEEDFHAAWIWEKTIITYLQDWNIRPILKLIRRGNSHYKSQYIIEGTLLCLLSKEKSHIPKLPKIRNLQRHKHLRSSKNDFFFQAAAVIQDCYDYEIPLRNRLVALGEQLGKTNKIVSIDKEMLIWGCAIRWLNRSKAFDFLALCMKEYNQKSLMISNGTNKDVYNFNMELNQELVLPDASE